LTPKPKIVDEEKENGQTGSAGPSKMNNRARTSRP
jgi:hypothetical protein